MRTLLLLALVVLFATTTNATNYYFSAVSGDDSRTATEAKNPSTPWKTLSKLNSFFPSLQPGDSVLLKRGETFYGYIKVGRSGTASLPIVIGAYGTGNKPIVTSFVTMNNWVSKGNGIWESYNSSLLATLNIVTLNGAEQAMGRFPNRDAANEGYLNFESHVGKTSITDKELTTTTNWTGAELVIRSRRWLLERSTITSHSGGTLTSASTATYEPFDNYGYFFQNSLKTLDKFGEWYYNPSTKKLSVYFGSNSPSSYTISAATINELLFSANYSNITFDNIVAKGANEAGVDILNGSNIRIQNCEIIFSGIDGVDVNGHTGFIMENSIISNSHNNGMKWGYGVNSSTVKNNKILNTNLFPGMGQNKDGNGIGFYINGDNNTIKNNEIRNTGYIGLSFKGNYVSVTNNYIDSFCLVKDDGAGIYSYGYNAFLGDKIIGNVVVNGIGAPVGTYYTVYSTSGIYMDNNNSDVEIRDNTLANCRDYGLYIHNSSNKIIKRNTCYNNSRRQLAMIQEIDRPSTIRNHVITNNILFSKFPDQVVSHLESSQNDFDYFAKLDSNYYARPLDDRITITNFQTATPKTLNFDLEAWRKTYGEDQYSKRTCRQISPYKVNSIIGSNKVTNGTFVSGITGVGASSCTTSYGTTSGVLDGGYLQVAASVEKASVNVKIGSITAGRKYILKYSLKNSADDNMIISTFLRLGGSPYTALTEKQNRKAGTSRTENEMIFISPVTETLGAIVFQSDKAGKYYIDNIQVYEADATMTNVDDSIKFVYNSTQSSKSFSLTGSYVDAKGSNYSNSITLSPYTSAVLIKTSSSQETPVAPTVGITSPVANAKFGAPASITISATAADSDGSISKVDFYNGSTLLGSDNTSPYSYSWSNVAAGNYSITAKATDNSSLTTTSSAVAVSVSSNAAPSVSITSPASGAKFETPASVVLSASAADTDGTITKVDFYNGSTLLGSDNTSPYSFTWSNVAVGSYSITAKATDNGSLVTTSSPVSFTVSNTNTAPTVSITSPTATTKFEAPASVTISAVATDDGSVSKVDFYNGTTLLGSDNTSPYSFTWTNVAAGSYSLTAKATDNNSLSATSSTVTVTVSKPNAAPTVSISSPAINTKFNAPASITISATAADSDGSVTKVDFYNGNTLLGSDNTSPYSFTWSNVAAGNYSLTAKATDNGSLVTSSTAVTLSVITPNGAPTVSITSPTADTKFVAPASVTISATASDSDGSVTKVDFYNGTTLLGSDNTSPYSFTWSNVAAGSYSITAKATDNGSLVSTSLAVNIKVSTNAAPSVSITSPVVNAKFDAPASVIISAIAADADGSVTKVDFYNGATLLHTENESPYEWTWANVPAGNYSITAKATDNAALVTTSSAIAITVSKPNAAPSVGITSPVADAKFDAPASITINAAATDDDGSVTKVDFYNGDILLGSSSTSPYTFTWNNVAPGTYSLTAKATDNGSLVTTSSVVTVSVAAVAAIQNIAPTIKMTSPVTNSNFYAPTSVKLSADANDPDGYITKVEFLSGTSHLYNKYEAPFTCTLRDLKPGNYKISAKATDDKGVTTQSDFIYITVAPNTAPSVSITSPSIDSKFNASSDITINAAASDSNGLVSKVDFYNGETFLGSDNTSPYSFTWGNVPTGSYFLTAKAIDNGQLVTTSLPISISVGSATVKTAPIITITSPESNAILNALTNVTITAAAVDGDGSITKVEFYKGDTLLGSDNTSPYTFTIDSVKVGSYSIIAKAFDNDNLSAVSAAKAFTVKIPAFVFKSFTGSVSGKQINLVWSTNNTRNTNYFRVLRGKRRTSLKEMGRITYTPSANEALSYSYSDLAPSSGSNYYKIVQVDKFGVSISSSIVLVDASTMARSYGGSVETAPEMKSLEEVNIKVGPNPTSSTLYVYTNSLQSNEELKISVLSITGQVLKTIPANASNQVSQLNVSSLKAGTYVVQIISGDKIINKKFVKQ
jgi:parallel beta-helix repeat protein